MCSKIIQFCSGSTKYLLFGGAAATSILTIALGYTGYYNQSFYKELDASVAQQESALVHTFYFQLLVAGYLFLVALLACFAAHYDQKHSIRAVS